MGSLTSTIDHGALTGLSDDDHTGYVLRSILTTRGDLPVRGASDWTRLGVGGANTVLTADGTDPAWSATPTVTTLTTTGLLTAGNGLTVSAGNILAASSILSLGTSATTAQANILSGAADRISLIVDTAASPSASGIAFHHNGSLGIHFFSNGLRRVPFDIPSWDSGNNVQGPKIVIGRNNNATKPGAGFIAIFAGDNAEERLWVDSSDLLRINPSADPIYDNDGAGTVVGDQTSWHEAKDVIAERHDTKQALATICGTKVYDYTFKEDSYKTPDDNYPMYVGVVGLDRHDWFLKNVGRRQNPVLDLATMHGFTFLAIQELAARVRALEA